MYKIADRVLLTLFLLTLFQPFFRRLVYYAEPIKQSRLSNALMPQRLDAATRRAMIGRRRVRLGLKFSDSAAAFREAPFCPADSRPATRNNHL
jgi:hypothetical protein